MTQLLARVYEVCGFVLIAIGFLLGILDAYDRGTFTIAGGLAALYIRDRMVGRRKAPEPLPEARSLQLACSNDEAFTRWLRDRLKEAK